jgi:hypothetical protein
MCSKTISDCVEAIIGAYYVGGGLRAALSVLKWLGVDADIEEELIIQTILNASMRTYLPKVDVIKMLEAKLGYAFSVKGLLLEALTHPSHQESAESYSYQVLVDVTCYSYWCLLIFIMQFLYQKHHMFFVTASGIPWRCCLGYSINTTSFQ